MNWTPAADGEIATVTATPTLLSGLLAGTAFAAGTQRVYLHNASGVTIYRAWKGTAGAPASVAVMDPVYENGELTLDRAEADKTYLAVAASTAPMWVQQYK